MDNYKDPLAVRKACDNETIFFGGTQWVWNGHRESIEEYGGGFDK